MLSNIWNGRYSVGQQYWLCLVLPMGVITLLGKAGDAVAESDSVSSLDAFMFVMFVIFATIAIMVIGGVGLLRAVKRTGWTTWGTIAVVFLGLGVLRNTATIGKLLAIMFGGQ
jgi:asparagine N-glycosylation enzyme membrane subunit Stt3